MIHCRGRNFYAASVVFLLLLSTAPSTQAFTSSSCCHPPRIQSKSLPLPLTLNTRIVSNHSSPPFRTSSHRSSILAATASDASLPPSSDSGNNHQQPPQTITLTKQQKRLQQIKSEGGPLSFQTKYGALNPFAIYYGITSILLGIVWFVALSIMQILYKITGDRFDRKRRIPVFLSQCWGTALLALTGCFPRIENWGVIREFHKR